MSGSAIVDTNILLYVQDAESPEKRERADAVLAALLAREAAVLTAQVLGEFFSAGTKKLRRPMSPQEASEVIDRLSRLAPVLDTTLAVVTESARGARRYGMPYYDAQIWASARLNGIGIVLTEDMRCAPEIEGVRFADPFAPDFDLEALLGEAP